MKKQITVSMVALVFFCGSQIAHAISTTDYLVRLEALAYLEEQIDERSQIVADMAKKSQELKEITESETMELAQTVDRANREISELIAQIKDEIEILSLATEANKKPVKEMIARLQGELTALESPGFTQKIVNGQKKTWTEFVFGKARLSKREEEELKRKEIDRLKRELGFWQTNLEQIRIDIKNPEVLSKQVEEKYLEARVKLEAEREDAIRAIEEIKKQTDILDLATQGERLKAREASMSARAACVIKLSGCKDIKSWDTFEKSHTFKCKHDFLQNAKKKAVNPACVKLDSTSPWEEIHDCIPEYRAQILKGKKGELGSRTAFDSCLAL